MKEDNDTAKKENSERFISNIKRCDLKWSLNVITIGKNSELEENYIIIYIGIFFLN